MRLIAPLALIAVVTACGPARVAKDMFVGDQGLGTPQPFMRDNRNDALLQTPFLRGALIVAPAEWLSTADEARFRGAMADALRRADVAALLEPARTGTVSHMLVTRREGVDIIFELHAPSGETIADFRADGVVAGGAPDWTAFGAAAGRETARLITELEGDPTPERAPVTVAVVSMTGAPADGDDALPRALRAILAQGGPVIGYRVLPASVEIPADALRIEGETVTAPAEGGRIRVRLSWRLVGPDGETLGAVSQTNTVPAGAFASGWGPAAFDAAQGAAEGLGALLDRARSSMESAPAE